MHFNAETLDVYDKKQKKRFIMNLRLSIIASTLLLAACDQVNDLPVKYPGQQQEEPNTAQPSATETNNEIKIAPLTGTIQEDRIELILAFKDGVERDPSDVAKAICDDLGRDRCLLQESYSGDITISIPSNGESSDVAISSAKRLFGNDLKYVEPQWNFEAIRKDQRQFTPQ